MRLLPLSTFQSLASMPLSIQPIKNFEELTPESLQKLTADKDHYSSPSVCGYNPFIYGNDVDSVDVATRVAMVSEPPLIDRDGRKAIYWIIKGPPEERLLRRRKRSNVSISQVRFCSFGRIAEKRDRHR